MSASTNLRPVLLPLGWPEEDSEREALTRVLLAAGADIERLLDTPSSSPEAFVRHATRMPFLRSGHEYPIVAFAPKSANVRELLNYRSMLLTAVRELRNTTWLVYLSVDIRDAFHEAVLRHGDLFDAKGGIFTWYVSQGILGLVSRDTWVAKLAVRLEELLAPCPDSGIIPMNTPLREFRPGNSATTEPAPSNEVEPFREFPYAAVAGNAMPPLPRSLSPSAFSIPIFRPSSVPPNPRLRKR